MVRKETRKDSLLRLISDLGSQGTREQINEKVPEYWELSDEELEIEEGVGKPLYWHHVASVCQSLKDRDGYLENPKRGVWKITEVGKKHLSSIGHRPSLLLKNVLSQTTGDLPLCKELREAQRNSDNPTIFEDVLANTFQQFGFSVKHIGGSNEPDILIEGYRIILDGKTTKERVIGETYVNFNALKRYKEKYDMKYIGVIAPGFSGGNIQDTAKREDIALIETESICRILQNHTIYPYELGRIVEILFESGKSIITPNDVPPSTTDQEKLIEIVAKVLSDIKRTRKNSCSSRDLHNAYSWQGLNYEIDDIENALKFLSVEPFSILRKQDDKYSLMSDIESILKKIGLLLQAFNKMER